MEPIDVVMLTKNSEHLLNKRLKPIYGNVPVKHLIVVDGFSNDNTLKIINEFNKRGFAQNWSGSISLGVE